MLDRPLITPAYAQSAPAVAVRRRSDGVPADDRDLRRLLLPADPSAAEEGEGGAGDARGARRRATRSSPPAASLGRISKLGDQYATIEIADRAPRSRSSAAPSRNCCPRARSRRCDASHARADRVAAHLAASAPPTPPTAMNRYPLWKYLIIAVALVVGIVYTRARISSPRCPPVQVSSSKAGVKVDSALLGTVEDALKARVDPVPRRRRSTRPASRCASPTPTRS